MAGVENDDMNADNESDNELGNHEQDDKDAYKMIEMSEEMKRIFALRGRGRKPKPPKVSEYPKWPPVCEFNTSSIRSKRETFMKNLEQSATNDGCEWIGLWASRNPTRYSTQQFAKGSLALKLAQTQEYENLVIKWIDLVMEEQRERRATEVWQENRRKSIEAAKQKKIENQQLKASKSASRACQQIPIPPGMNSNATLEKSSTTTDATVVTNGTESPFVLDQDQSDTSSARAAAQNQNSPKSTSEDATSTDQKNEPETLLAHPSTVISLTVETPDDSLCGPMISTSGIDGDLESLLFHSSSSSGELASSFMTPQTTPLPCHQPLSSTGDDFLSLFSVQPITRAYGSTPKESTPSTPPPDESTLSSPSPDESIQSSPPPNESTPSTPLPEASPSPLPTSPLRATKPKAKKKSAVGGGVPKRAASKVPPGPEKKKMKSPIIQPVPVIAGAHKSTSSAEADGPREWILKMKSARKGIEFEHACGAIDERFIGNPKKFVNLEIPGNPKRNDFQPCWISEVVSRGTETATWNW